MSRINAANADLLQQCQQKYSIIAQNPNVNRKRVCKFDKIKAQKKVAGVQDDAVLIACIYLGYMDKATFIGA